MLAWALSACQEDGPSEGGSSDGEPSSQRPPGERASIERRGGALPFPELGRLAEIVKETRAILPRLPAATPPSLTDGKHPARGTPRRVLAGEGRLLRPGAFPRLPARLRVEVYLRRDGPPSGYLRIGDGRGAASRWRLLSGRFAGNRREDFHYLFRVSDPASRLRYFVLLGLLHRSDGKRFRSFEGYLIHPLPDGTLSPRGAIYPIDFGYRHPEPPPPVPAAKALAGRIEVLKAQRERWLEAGREMEELAAAAARLEEAQVPSGQAARRREDLADYRRRIAALREERLRTDKALPRELEAAYGLRTELATAWEAFVKGNAYRWRTPAEKRAAYAPLQKLRALYPILESLYNAVEGDTRPSLKQGRAAMERAVLNEEELRPPAEK